MQRSRKSLLTIRELWKTNRKNLFYKVFLPLVVFMWGLLFLLYIRIGHDDGYRDGQIDFPKDSYTYQTEIESKTIQNHSDLINKTQQIHFSFPNEQPKETKTERFSVQDLDEFKNKAFGGAKIHPSNPNPENIIHRLEPSGVKYNYASSSKGAKVLAHNKEAKGAPNILNTDQNQYLRNPCSSEDNHYGTAFYCTLSDVRDYGVDAVEMMLEDFVFARNNEFLSNEHEGDGKPEPEGEPWLEERANVPDPHVGRLPGDSVLRLLMQKVRLLDINLTVLERFLDELNSRYGYIFREIDAEIGERDVVVEKVRMDLRDLHESKDVVMEQRKNMSMSWNHGNLLCPFNWIS
ncbi:unnamed protein product [Lactuca virosa]|uniref:Uncharacterized protein n=1 Tax=Lactuca virosa TaxID=75947 RepID=A0AAU9MKT4_9ASTR|nr:unnamed protein product [Lactuca virosa]